MQTFNQADFNDFVLSSWVIWFFSEAIKYKSWRTWNYYVNWRNATEDVYIINKLTDYILAFTKDLNLIPDCFYWVPEWWTKLWVITQFKYAMSLKPHEWSHVLPMWRAKPKDHWAPKDRFFVWMPRWKVVVIEDTITTWWSLLSTLESLLNSNVDVVWVIGLTDRDEVRDDWLTPGESIQELWLNYHVMSHASQLLVEAFRRQKPWIEVGRKIEEYYAKYSKQRVKLV